MASITLPDEDANQVVRAQIQRPLDFTAVTDHSEFLGPIELCTWDPGTLAYWSELPALDMLGLNDRYLATHPPADFGQGGLGHELGDADYVEFRAVRGPRGWVLEELRHVRRGPE